MLNMDKTEAIVISAVNTRAHATVDVVIDVCGCVVTLAPYVRDIGVWFDSAMSMAKNVSRMCQMAYCQLRSIARIRRSIGLFANDVIIIGSVRADWPAPFNVTIGNPRADKLGRNGFECIVLRCSVDRERCVLITFMCRQQYVIK